MFPTTVTLSTVLRTAFWSFPAARCTNIWAIMIITWRRNPNRALLQEKEAQRRKKENALKKCEEQIASLEERDKQIDLEMSDPKIATDVAALQKLSREKDEIADKLMELMEEWEQLSE